MVMLDGVDLILVTFDFRLLVLQLGSFVAIIGLALEERGLSGRQDGQGRDHQWEQALNEPHEPIIGKVPARD